MEEGDGGRMRKSVKRRRMRRRPTMWQQNGGGGRGRGKLGEELGGIRRAEEETDTDGSLVRAWAYRGPFSGMTSSSR